MKTIIFYILMLTIVMAVIIGTWFILRKYISRGEDLNRKAWESSYRERKMPIPANGPREGYWGDRLGRKIPDRDLGWHEPEMHYPGLLEIDNHGRQRYQPATTPVREILIIGGSVAFGANASSIDTTYYTIAGRELERQGVATGITVMAAGAWKSIQELRAMEICLREMRPDLVVFLNGLNDLTNGSTARALYGEVTPTRDGSAWSVEYHEHDYAERVAGYLAHMDKARRLVLNTGIGMLVILQPSLNERSIRTSLEAQLLAYTMELYGTEAEFSTRYAEMAHGLEDMARSGGMVFMDASRLLDRDMETVFTDIWHFTDFGHRLLGETFARKVGTLLTSGGLPLSRTGSK